MHVLIVSEYCRPWPGGISEHVHFEAQWLRSRGHKVTVLSGPAPPASDSDTSIMRLRAAAHFESNGAASRLSADGRLLRMRRWLRALEPSVVHVHAPFDPILPLVSVLASPVPVVGTVHASFSPSAAWRMLYTQPLAKIAAKKLSRIIAVSAEAERSLSPYVSATFVRIPNGVDTERFQSVPRQTLSRPRVLFVGRPDSRKGLDVLLAACAQLPQFEWHLVGPAPTHVPPGVVVHGYVRPEEMARHLRAATVLCAPSLGGESQGIVLLEAMAAGTPIVASDIAGYRDVVQSNHNGVLVKPGSVHELTAALRTVCHDTVLQNRLSANGLASAEAYAWKNVGPQIEHVLETATHAS